MFEKLVRRLRREAFITSPLAIVISPVYFIRNGLYKHISSLAPAMGGDFLDFGCGSKPYESLFANRSSYTGVDVQVSGHDHRTSRIDVYYDGKTLPFADRRFDSTVCFEVFEHVFNIDEALTEIWRVLKPGGQLLLSVPFAWDEHEIPYDFARYTSFGIKSVLERNNFEVVEMRKTTTYIVALCQVFIAYLSRYVLPKNRIIASVFQLALIFPLNLATLFLNFVFPMRYEYYCNNVVLARKPSTP
ncbi:MAG: class I SAM-dependent methyltransferase [Gemmatimonadaceae bacterium]